MKINSKRETRQRQKKKKKKKKKDNNVMPANCDVIVILINSDLLICKNWKQN